jgi:uncharacterized protein
MQILARASFMRIPSARWLGLVTAFVLAVGLTAHAQPTFPVLTGRVTDQADILPAPVETQLSAKLEGLEQATSRQLAVVTISSLQGYQMQDYAYHLGRSWGLGEARKDTGILLVVAPNEQRVGIEAGYGLKGIVTEAYSNQILNGVVLPLFREGKIPDGVVAGADALLEQLSLPDDQARARAANVASGEARADPLSLLVIGVVAVWIAFGLIRAFTGRKTDVLFWPLAFMAGGRRRETKDKRGGHGGSLEPGGASGRW